MKKLLLFCLLLCACDAPTVPERLRQDVYDFRLITPAPKVLHWPVGTTVHVFTVTDADAIQAEWLREGVRFGMNAWNTAALYGEVKFVAVSAVADADVVVQYSLSTSPLNTTNCVPGGGLAYTTFCLDSGGEHLAAFPLRDGGDSRVKFLVTVRSGVATDAEGVRRLVSHELGHTLGLAQHSPLQTDLMYAGVLLRADPNTRDRATLEVLYHTVPDITP